MADIIGTTGSDTLHGSDGADTIDGITGTDFLYGGDGDDRFIFTEIKYSTPTPPVGLVDGGAGIDEIDLSELDSASFSGSRFTIGSQTIDIVGIERIKFGDYGHHIDINQSGYQIVTGEGDDDFTIDGSAQVDSSGGDDIFLVSGDSVVGTGALYSGGGTDLLDAGIMADIDLEAGFARLWQTNYAISGFENVTVVGYGPDTAVRGDASDNVFLFSDSSFTGGLLDGRGGNDTLIGSKYSDRLYGGDGNDILDGKAGADAISGGAGYDLIFGSAGDDLIFGSADGDMIDGGAGRDVLKYDGLARNFDLTVDAGSMTVRLGDGVDQISGVEEIRFRDATLTFDADSDAAFVMRLYDVVLGRKPDAMGFDFWTDAMAAGVSRLSVANGFLQSEELNIERGNLSNTQFVEFLYVLALKRPSDADGMNFWSAALDRGVSREEVLMGFSESEEHRVQTAQTLGQGLWTTDDNYQKVAALYDAFADRLPDAEGLTYHVSRLQEGATLTQVAQDFAASPEFLSRTAGFSNSDLVDFMYANALDRPADTEGKRFWVDHLNAGLSKADLLTGFSESVEHYMLSQNHLFHGVDFLL